MAEKSYALLRREEQKRNHNIFFFRNTALLSALLADSTKRPWRESGRFCGIVILFHLSRLLLIQLSDADEVAGTYLGIAYTGVMGINRGRSRELSETEKRTVFSLKH